MSTSIFLHKSGLVISHIQKNLPSKYDAMLGYTDFNGIAPVCVGVFITNFVRDIGNDTCTNPSADSQYLTALAEYMVEDFNADGN